MVYVTVVTPERSAQFADAVTLAKETLQPGDRLLVAMCGGVKTTVTFKGWSETFPGFIETPTLFGDQVHPFNILKVNGRVLRFIDRDTFEVDRSEVVGYRAGLDRNEQNALSHTYAMMDNGDLWPMCPYGWNRSDGSSFSILRQPPGTEGECKLCQRNVAAGRRPVTDGSPHKTKWL